MLRKEKCSAGYFGKPPMRACIRIYAGATNRDKVKVIFYGRRYFREELSHSVFTCGRTQVVV